MMDLTLTTISREIRAVFMQLLKPASRLHKYSLRSPQDFIIASAVVLMATILFYICYIVVYRLSFSPLAGFPGPRLAAATGWVEFYYDYFKQGSYIYEIEKMHQKYGPLVRINPHELSLHDPSFYNEIYCSGSKRRTDNYNHFGKGIDFDGSHFLTTPHALHRRRRKPLEPYFSRAGVVRIEPTLRRCMSKLMTRLEGLRGTGIVARLDHAFAAFTGDVIGAICCEDREEFLDDPDFAPHWYDLLHAIIKSIPLFMGLPWLINIINLIPEKFIAWMDPRSSKFTDFKKMTCKHISEAKRDRNIPDKDSSEGSRASIFRYLVQSEMPESELSTERLAKEAQVLLGAGTVSSARTLVFICYYVLSNKNIKSKLEAELIPLMSGYPDVIPSFTELEKLPYLSALIKEGLRLSFGNMHRLPRCSPDVAIQYKQWTIPRGVPVGMSAYLMHLDPIAYKNPLDFEPDRWLDPNPLLSKNYVPFSRGSRSCLGMNLAYAEMYIILATLFRLGGPNLELFETDESDVIQLHDFLLPLPRLDSKGIRVIVQ